MDPATGAVASDVGSLGSSIAASFVSLGIVCLLAFLALRWLSRRPIGPNTGPLRVVARQALDPRRAVYVIEAGERCFLVGAGEGPMTMLAELDRDAVERGLEAQRPKRRSGPGPLAGRFAEILARTIAGPPRPPGPMSPRPITDADDALVASPVTAPKTAPLPAARTEPVGEGGGAS